MDDDDQNNLLPPYQKFLDETRFFLKNGGDPNRWIEPGHTLLHAAAELLGSSDVIIDLVTAGAHINSVNEFGNTPLQVAVMKLNHRAVNAFLECGALVNTMDYRGYSVLHTAIDPSVNKFAYSKYVARKFLPPLPDLDIIKKLLQNQETYVDVRDPHGNTPLLMAVRLNNIGIVEALLERSANVNISNCFGETPLHAAVSCPNPRIPIIFHLLSREARVCFLDSNGKSPLDIAAGRYENVETRAFTMEFIKLVAFFDKDYKQCELSLKKNDILSVYYKNCCEEIIRMLNESIVGHSSLHSFLLSRMYKEFTPQVEACKDIVKVLMSDRYVIYMEMILSCIQKYELHTIIVETAVSCPYESIELTKLYSLILTLKLFDFLL